MAKNLSIRYHEFGKPLEVLQVEELPMPDPGPDEVLVKLRAAAVNPSDFGMILGKYGNLKELPATAGREALGEIVAFGSEVTDVQEGQWVRMPEEPGAWQTYAVQKAENLFRMPNDIPEELAAMAFVNPPTAWRLLRDADVDSDSWVIQNAANSAVGIYVIQMAKHLGIKTFNVVRREELIEPLKEMGADVVVLDNDDYPKQVKELTDGGYVGLALNSVGGESALRLVKALSPGAQHVTFGGMTFEPIRFPTRQLIFEDITLRGFWLDRWYRQSSKERIEVMFSKLYALMREKQIHAKVEARYPLSDFKKAIEHAQQPRFGKVLLVPDE